MVSEPTEDDMDLDERESAPEETWLREAAKMSFAARPEDQHVALPQIGDVVADKYRIEALLGEGGMGTVFRATHTVTQKPVALKWMKRSSADLAAAERFTREARAAGRITHPNVVDIYDIGHTDDASYLVMELLRGESLVDRMARERLSPQVAVDLMLPALRGAAEIHRQGVIHRDLKPGNIFLPLTSDGLPLGAKVLDFGISMLRADTQRADPTLTRDGVILGTPAYMAPEQLESARDVDERSDQYALGVILYELIGGALPFSATSYNALVIAIATKSPKPLRELCPDVPEGLAAVVHRAMHRDRAARFPDVTALIEALLPFSSAGQSRAGRQASGPVVSRAPVRTRMRAALMLLLLSSLVAITWLWFRARPAEAVIARAPSHAPPAAASMQTAVSAANAPIAVPTREPTPAREALPSTLPARVPERRVVVRVSSPSAGAETLAAPVAMPNATAPRTTVAKPRAGAISLDEL